MSGHARAIGAVPAPRPRRTRRRHRLGAVVAVGALLAAGALAGCADSTDLGGADRPTSPATGVEAGSVLPAANTAANPDVNRERAWEKVGVHPNDP